MPETIVLDRSGNVEQAPDSESSTDEDLAAGPSGAGFVRGRVSAPIQSAAVGSGPRIAARANISTRTSSIRKRAANASAEEHAAADAAAPEWDPEILAVVNSLKRCPISMELLWPGKPVFEHDGQHFCAVAFLQLVSSSSGNKTKNPCTRKEVELADLERLADALLPSAEGMSSASDPFSCISSEFRRLKPVYSNRTPEEKAYTECLQMLRGQWTGVLNAVTTTEAMASVFKDQKYGAQHKQALMIRIRNATARHD